MDACLDEFLGAVRKHYSEDLCITAITSNLFGTSHVERLLDEFPWYPRKPRTEADDPPDALVAFVAAHHIKMMQDRRLMNWAADMVHGPELQPLGAHTARGGVVVGAFWLTLSRVHEKLVLAALQPHCHILDSSIPQTAAAAVVFAAIEGALLTQFLERSETRPHRIAFDEGMLRVAHHLLDQMLQFRVPPPTMGVRRTCLNRSSKICDYKLFLPSLLGLIPALTRYDRDQVRDVLHPLFFKLLELEWSDDQLLTLLEETLVRHEGRCRELFDPIICRIQRCNNGRGASAGVDEVHSVLYNTVLADALQTQMQGHHTKRALQAIHFPDASLEKAALLAAKMHEVELMRHIIGTCPSLKFDEQVTMLSKHSDPDNAQPENTLNVAANDQHALGVLLAHQEWSRAARGQLLLHLLEHELALGATATIEALLLPPHSLTERDLPEGEDSDPDRLQQLRAITEQLYRPDQAGASVAHESFKRQCTSWG